MDIRDTISRTKREFESSFAESDYYDKQTRDEKHLTQILDNLSINEKDVILDLGTGSGYLAFPIALKHPGSKVIGLDIITKTLEANDKKAEDRGITNIQFIDYNGISLPFADETFDLIVTRYALHHFPDIEAAFKEMSRVLKKGGQLFLSDPTPNANDTKGFVDAYMQMKEDGHIKFYTQNELIHLAKSVGLEPERTFTSSIRFPRKEAELYEELIQQYEKEIIDSYDIQVIDHEIYITEQVLNISFFK